MILETLNRIRSKNTAGKKRSGLEAEDEGDEVLGDVDTGYQPSPSQQSTRSNATVGSPSTPSARSAKRYSNNLFGSGRSRDFTVTRSLTTRTSRSTTSSIAGTEGGSTFSDRPVTPDSSGATSSAQSTPEKASLVRSASLAAPGPYGDQSNLTSIAEYRLSKTLGPSGLKRASLAFEDAIKSMALIEEDAEEEILMPRTPFNRPPSRSPNTTVRCNHLSIAHINSLSRL
jgi:serine/arginine repetitive matrix protein 2